METGLPKHFEVHILSLSIRLPNMVLWNLVVSLLSFSLAFYTYLFCSPNPPLWNTDFHSVPLYLRIMLLNFILLIVGFYRDLELRYGLESQKRLWILTFCCVFGIIFLKLCS
jgi:hypothetical protein